MIVIKKCRFSKPEKKDSKKMMRESSQLEVFIKLMVKKIRKLREII